MKLAYIFPSLKFLQFIIFVFDNLTYLFSYEFTEMCPALGHKGYVPLMKQSGAYNLFQNIMFLPLIKKALMEGIGSRPQTGHSLVDIVPCPYVITPVADNCM